MRWTVLVPMKALPAAKSRLARDVPARWHAELVTAIRADTLSAARASTAVTRVLVVSDTERLGIDDAEHLGVFDAAAAVAGALVQSSPGLNGALSDGAAHAALHWPLDGIAALVGDLPALHAHELTAALDAAAGHDRAFVPDRFATGTVLLTAAAGTVLHPRFGEGSAARHARDAVPISGGDRLRTDVDSVADLAAAVTLGVGPATHAVLDRSRLLG